MAHNNQISYHIKIRVYTIRICRINLILDFKILMIKKFIISQIK